MSVISDYSSRGKAVFIVTTTTFVLASVFVAARLVSRFVVLKSRTADDWCIVLAWLIAFGLSFSIDWGTSKGLGRHDADIPAAWQPSLRESEYAFTILYNPALMATKTSILIFYIRMSKNTQTLLRVASYVTLGVVNVAGVVLTFLNAFQCNPSSAAYNPLAKNDICLSIVTLFLCSAPVNIITDLAILVLPIPVLTGMHLPQRQKTVLVFTFALGIFVTVVDVIRVYYLQQAVTDQLVNQAHLGTELEFAWNASMAFMWSAVEVNVGIICACIPTLKPLIKRILPAMLRSSEDNSRADKSTSISSQFVDPLDHPQRASSIADPTRAHVNGSEEEMGFVDFLTSADGQGRTIRRENNFLTMRPDGVGGAAERQDAMDFLTTADGLGSSQRSSFQPTLQESLQRATTEHTPITENTVYFGFVNMRRPKSMLKTKGRESFKYCALVTILFFLWGFSYGLLNTLNDEIAAVAQQTQSQALGLTPAYFGAYFFGALTVGQYFLRHFGFKATFIAGLCIYGTGTLMFWPSAVLLSYPGFIISQFVVGFGLAVLETAANPFIALCGPPQYAECRLLLSQAIQAVSSIVAQILATKVLFNKVQVRGSEALIDVQWSYLAIALFAVILALFFFYMPLPEASDEDLDSQAEDLGCSSKTPVLSSLPRVKLVWVLIGMAIFAQFTYVSAQETLSIFFAPLLASLATPTSPSALTTQNYTLIAHALFAFSRFLFALLTLIIRPRILLLICFALTLIFSITTQVLASSSRGYSMNTTVVPTLLFFFAEGPIFPLIYAIALRGIGSRTKMTAAGLTASCVGGAGGIWVIFAIVRLSHKSIGYSFVVTIALAAFGCLYPLLLSGLPEARRWVDPKNPIAIGEERVEGDNRPESGTSSIRRFSKRLSVVFEMIKSAGKGRIEHREGR